MTGLNGKKLTSIEFNGYCKDVLKVLMKNTFSPEDELLFVTYQPQKLTLTANEVKEYTYKLFYRYKYVEVIEQTFKSKKGLRYNYGAYINGYHSHVLIKKSDYYKIKENLEGFNFVDKVVYDLDGLTERYLVKQAGITYNRLLPTNNIPTPQLSEGKEITTKTVTAQIVRQVKLTVLKPFQRIKNGIVLLMCFINKIDSIHMFIDDT